MVHSTIRRGKMAEIKGKSKLILAIAGVASIVGGILLLRKKREPEEPIGNFVYSNATLEMRYYSELKENAGANTIYAVFSCDILNNAGERGTRDLGLYWYYYSPFYDKYSNPKLIREYQLALEAQDLYHLVFDPRVDPEDLWLGGRAETPEHQVTFYFYLADSAEGESSHASAQ